MADKTDRPLRRLAGRMKRLVIIAGVTYLVVVMLTGWLQEYLIYFPSRAYDQTPRDIGLAFEDVTLTTTDGIGIAAWYVPANADKGSIIYCHGNAGNIADRLLEINLLHLAGYNVLMFDYRGYGQSEGKPTEEGTYLDADAAWRYLQDTRHEPAKRIAIIGRSLGGAVAIDLASRHNPGALVLESTFTSLADVGRLHYPLLPVRWILTYRYESIAKIPLVTCPKLHLHATDDTLVPIALGRALFEKATDPKTFIETPGDHTFGGFTYSPAYTQQVTGFLDATLDGAAR